MSMMKELFEAERNIPYRIPLSCAEEDHCCSGKHERLLKAFRIAGVEARYRVCWFKWSDLSLPADVAAVPHEDECSHVYIEAMVDGAWRVIDATWDPGLASVFPINKWGSEMRVAVPSIKTLSPEESAEFMGKLTAHDTEIDLEKHREFYIALNGWFEGIRK